MARKYQKNTDCAKAVEHGKFFARVHQRHLLSPVLYNHAYENIHGTHFLLVRPPLNAALIMPSPANLGPNNSSLPKVGCSRAETPGNPPKKLDARLAKLVPERGGIGFSWPNDGARFIEDMIVSDCRERPEIG